MKAYLVLVADNRDFLYLSEDSCLACATIKLPTLLKTWSLTHEELKDLVPTSILRCQCSHLCKK
jgi:hypothetical protein